MAIKTTFDDIQADRVRLLEQNLIGSIRSIRPTLDLRQGTALRDLLVAPCAEAQSLAEADLLSLRSQLDLAKLASSSNPDSDVVASVQSNYGVVQRPGVAATGRIIVNVSSPSDIYVASGTVASIGDKTYAVEGSHLASLSDPGTAATFAKLTANVSGTGYYFILPVAASDIGAEYNAVEGTSVTLSSVLFPTLVSSEVYEAISGGTDAETLPELIGRMPQAVAYRGLDSPVAMSATIMEEFPEVTEVSSVGMGHPEMLRDKHNPFGTSVGSRVDVYIRTGRDLESVTITKEAVHQGSGTYMFTLNRDDAPGFYAIRGITDVDSTLTYDPDNAFSLAGSAYPFTETRRAEGLSGSGHDFDVSSGYIETAYTRWQVADIAIAGVPLALDGTWPASREFKVSMYRMRRIDAVQDFIDGRSIGRADHVIRGMLPCIVSLSVPVYKLVSTALDVEAMRTALVNLVNGLKVGEALTMSAISSLLHGYEIVRVGLDLGPGEFEMNGSVRGASGTIYSVSGTVLDVTRISAPADLVTVRTTAFMTTKDNVSIDVRNL